MSAEESAKLATDGRKREKRLRISPQSKSFIAEFLNLRGHKCTLCQLECHVDYGSLGCFMEIDHINGKKNDNRIGNYRWLCKPCNTRERNKQVLGLRNLVEDRAKEVGEREKAVESQSSLEIEINVELFPRYQAWIGEQILERAPLKVREAIHGGAMYLRKTYGHGSATTTRKWLNDLTSMEGPFEIWDSKEHGRCVRFRIGSEALLADWQKKH